MIHDADGEIHEKHAEELIRGRRPVRDDRGL